MYHMRLILLEWDTKFFNKRIGRLDIGSNNEFEYLNQLKDFDIVYIFSPVKISIDAPLMDVKVTYSKSIETVTTINEIVQFDIHNHDYDQLLELVYQSGHDSRFLKDPSFGINDFKRLYKQWIDSSIADKNTLVLIHYDGVNIGGFVTLKNNINYSQIGLIAVDSENHGNGIGKKLINAVESKLKIGKMLLVATQQTNIVACKFYENLGFIVEKKEYIYHYKHDSI